MNISSAITYPLTLNVQEPFILLVDMHTERRRWVVSLLTFAHYHVRAVATPQEFFTWYLQHPMVPQAILIGQSSQQNLFFVQRFLQRMDTQREKAIPVLLLVNYLPFTISLRNRTFNPNAAGCFALLEDLWRVVPRHD